MLGAGALGEEYERGRCFGPQRGGGSEGGVG